MGGRVSPLCSIIALRFSFQRLPDQGRCSQRSAIFAGWADQLQAEWQPLLILPYGDGGRGELGQAGQRGPRCQAQIGDAATLNDKLACQQWPVIVGEGGAERGGGDDQVDLLKSRVAVGNESLALL